MNPELDFACHALRKAMQNKLAVERLARKPYVVKGYWTAMSKTSTAKKKGVRF